MTQKTPGASGGNVPDYHAEIIPITGDSYRQREAEAALKARRGKT